MSDLDSTIDQMESPQRTPSKRKAYTIADKLEVIDRIHKGETHMQVSKAIHVPESTVRGWLKDEEQLRCIVATKGEAIKQQQRKRGKRKKQKNQQGIAGQINEGEPQKEGPDIINKVEPKKEGPDQINAGEPQKGGPGNTDKGEPQKKGKKGPYATDDKGMSEQAQADSGKSVIDLTDKPQKLQLKGKPSSDLKDLVTKTLEQPKKSRFRDGRLVARMKEYLAGLNNKNFVSIPLMADFLQNKYPEYRRKKKGPFVQYVDRAYFSLDKGTPLTDIKGVEISSEEEEEEEELVEYKDTNSLNSMMSNLYKSSPAHASDTQKRQTDCPSQAAKRLKVATETEKPEKILYPSPDAINRNLSSTGLVGSRRSIQDRYFIDRKGEEKINPEKDKTQANNSREANIKEFLTGLPSRTSFSAYVNTKQDPRLKSGTLYKVYRPTDQPSVEAPSHSGITGDNQGVSIEPPSSPGSPMSVTGDTDVAVIRDKDAQSTAQKDGGEPKSSGKEPKKKGTKRTKGGSRTKRQDDSDSDEPKNEKGLALQKSSLTFADVGGNDTTLTEICKLLVHMRHPEVYSQLGITPPRGFLLHGPPGCGKTLLANAIAGELDLPLLKIAATEIVSGVSGDSEQKVRELFDKALQSAPCVVFIDEIDSITPKRETASKDMERRIVAQLLACMDDLNSSTMAHVLVIGATNRPDSLDPALRRAGRFDREICLGIPDEHARRKILEVLCRPLKLSEGFEFSYLAKNTPGYVGADLMALSREAAMVAVNRVFQNLQSQSSNLSSNHIPAVAMDTTTSDNVTSSLSNEAASASQSGPQGLATHEQTTANCDTTNVYQGLGGSLLNGNQEDSHNGPNSFTSGLPCDGASGSAGDASCSNVMAHLSSLSQSVVKIEPCDEGLDNTNNSARSLKQNTASESSSTSLQNSIQRERRTAKEDLFSVLSWLKEHPPLTEEQLKDLFITMDDFKEALQCVQPSAKREGFATVPDVSWEDIGALQDVREELQLAVLAPVRHAEEFQSLGLCRAQGVLLAGPPGCGKTLLAKAVANESGINFISVKGPELLNMYVGESERAVRTVFQRARNSSPCVIFFDELDALCPRRSGSAEGGSSARVVNQLLTEMDGLEERKQVFIMAATNRPDIIDPAILRPGRLDKTLYVGLPTQADRRDILTCITKNGTKPLLAKDVDIDQLASDKRCDGFTGADLAALVREASVIALKEAILNKGRQPGAAITVTNHHFQVAFTKTKPSVSAKDQEKYKSMREKLQLPSAE